MTAGSTTYDYSFDGNGNLRSETTSRHFDWGHADQLKAFRTQTDGAEPSVHAHYLYDAAGQRVKKLVRKQGGQIDVTHYIDGVFEHHRWGPAAQPGENNHVHVLDQTQRVALIRIGTAHPQDTGPAVQFHLSDHLGSSNVVIDSAGVLTNREEFTPYGETSFGSFTSKRYRFTGRERDEESGLIHCGARLLMPWTGRWSNCDPAETAGGLNAYSYAHGNPSRLVDPGGMTPESPAQDLPVEDGFLQLPGEEVIQVTDVRPSPSNLDQHVKLGLTYADTRDEMQRQDTFKYEHTVGALSPAERVAYYRDNPLAESEYYDDLQQRHNAYWNQQEALLKSQQRTTDTANGAVKEYLIYLSVGAAGAVAAAALTTYGGITGTASLATPTSTAITTAGGTGAAVGLADKLEEAGPAVEAEIGAATSRAGQALAQMEETAEKVLYGPFRHGINKGGLADIVADQRLMSTAAATIAGGGERVRASIGAASTAVSYGGKTMIEFFTEIAPNWADKPMNWIGWNMPEGDFLDIYNITVYLSAD